VLISLAAPLVAFALLHALTRDLLGEEDARRAVLYLAVFPLALFLSAVYSEALYLALALAAFVVARWRAWLWRTLGDPWLFVHAQSDGWSRHRRPLGPLGGLMEGADAAWQGVK
jgi:hypothetical protein